MVLLWKEGSTMDFKDVLIEMHKNNAHGLLKAEIGLLLKKYMPGA